DPARRKHRYRICPIAAVTGVDWVFEFIEFGRLKKPNEPNELLLALANFPRIANNRRGCFTVGSRGRRMLSHEDNELLTRVGPGTPAGELLRRYWHPIAVAKELTAEKPTQFVRVLGEDLVLFRAKSGCLGLLADRCAHRGASLSYGRVEERGIACAYHGWLYDFEGQCLECPAEPAGSNFHKTVKQAAYPVQEHLNLVWAYLGPLPAPVLTHYDTLFRRDGHRKIVVHPRLDCNWFQAMENSVDPAHLQILHQEFYGRG